MVVAADHVVQLALLPQIALDGDRVGQPWPVAAFIPRWTLLLLIGWALLGAGMTWAARVSDVRTAGRYIRGLR